ncbi:thylakoid lumenal 15 kDa protein 1, chloroplastic isoform X2 [Phoenix dactylifera]|uniref:Thylakoid lumenal 15 kDa protein 1, chloroplastic isoform X2 n=1 Tax=Phoenix dactylifera TaxID=42345 RepID=A0A8B8J9J2_PHODC|nr:thylakoid lumenal 15 kDa protein 1, chloroplastic isoform X2 [Phoenix dactylifera]
MPMAALIPLPPIFTPTTKHCRLSAAPRLGSKSQLPSDHYVLSPPGRPSGHEKNPPLPVHPLPLPPVLGEGLGKASAVALLAASLFLADPAVAFKGGGPYGAEVTRGQDLTGKDFSGKNLVKQDFKTSVLRQANFRGAKLIGASFFDADLTGADLSDADLRGADFSLANITKANLSNANLEGALATGNTSFKGSVIYGAGLLLKHL